MKYLSLVALSLFIMSCGNAQKKDSAKTENTYEVSKTNAEWKEVLSSEEYHILRD